MAKSEFNGASKDFDDKVNFRTEDMQLAARVLCREMAKVEGKNVGDIVSEAIWEIAKDRLHPLHIKLALERGNVENIPEVL
ncbi:hypothetical protein DS891_01400 [Pseudoalteromonas sp. JC28]|uniref:hypothetical protein n=1 Tax=Pseudoalteromonas sp. JC28 TaxID=2267617 RepID=UPI001571F3FC|nr:hypothetical protein [Pseudoalteromonas sp. JC28]NSY32264.1 hypothetical protein [Pseudoalteromonas sp. JC28]